MSQDAMCNQREAIEACTRLVPGFDQTLPAKIQKAVEARTAWRIEGTLREFPAFPPVNLWFNYPVHCPDISGVLADITPEAAEQTWRRNFQKKKSSKERKEDRKTSIETAFEACGFDGQVTLGRLADYMGVTEKTVRNRLKEHGGFWIDEGNVGRK